MSDAPAFLPAHAPPRGGAAMPRVLVLAPTRELCTHIVPPTALKHINASLMHTSASLKHINASLMHTSATLKRISASLMLTSTALKHISASLMHTNVALKHINTQASLMLIVRIKHTFTAACSALAYRNGSVL